MLGLPQLVTAFSTKYTSPCAQLPWLRQKVWSAHAVVQNICCAASPWTKKKEKKSIARFMENDCVLNVLAKIVPIKAILARIDFV